MEVHDAGRRVRQVGELVIMGGEQRLRPDFGVGGQIFGDRPRDAQTVERRRSSADLVEDDETARRGGVEDVRRLLHLHHERRVAPGDIVRRADASVDTIDERDLGLARRHERASLRHDADERRLPEVR